jgi:putative ATP-binding cassette transporter
LKAYLFTLVFAMVAARFSFGQSNQDSVMAVIDKLVVESMHEGDIPGLSLVIIQNGIETIRNYGFADKNEGRKVTDQTLFELASCTKAFTAAKSQL